MNMTELAIIEQLAQLDENQQQQILALARQLVDEKLHQPFDLGEWLASARKIRAEIRESYGGNFYFNTQAVLDEIREEESE